MPVRVEIAVTFERADESDIEQCVQIVRRALKKVQDFRPGTAVDVVKGYAIKDVKAVERQSRLKRK
jgi:hypothetical protein